MRGGMGGETGHGDAVTRRRGEEDRKRSVERRLWSVIGERSELFSTFRVPKVFSASLGLCASIDQFYGNCSINKKSCSCAQSFSHPVGIFVPFPRVPVSPRHCVKLAESPPCPALKYFQILRIVDVNERIRFPVVR